MTTVVSGLHPLVSAALEARQCGTLTSVQHQILSRVASSSSASGNASGGTNGYGSKSGASASSATGGPHQQITSDCIVETPRGSGHCLCMVAYAAHFVHSHQQQGSGGGDAPFAVIVARDIASLVRIVNVSSVIAIPSVKFLDASCLDSSNKPGSATAPPLSRCVFVGTINHLANLDWGGAAAATAAAKNNCVTFIVEEACPGADTVTIVPATAASAASSSSSKINEGEVVAKIGELIGRVNRLWPNVNLCLMSVKPPSSVHPTLRYLLRRNNRAYLPARSAVPTFSSLLCLGSNDRAEICYRLVQTKLLRRILILTHNREVRELKTDLYKHLGVRTFAIQRTTATSERERILTDFLGCDYGVLVAMDAFTGIDMMDVDGVIQYYPPQKSMSDEDWTDFVTFLKTTGESVVERFRGAPNHGILRSSSFVVTLAAVDDLNLIKHFQGKAGFSGPVINISPKHVNFEDFVFQPNLAVLARLHPEEHESVWATSVPPGGAALSYSQLKEQIDIHQLHVKTGRGGAAYTKSSSGSTNQQQQQQQPSNASSNNSRLSIPAPSSSGTGSGAPSAATTTTAATSENVNIHNRHHHNNSNNNNNNNNRHHNHHHTDRENNNRRGETGAGVGESSNTSRKSGTRDHHQHQHKNNSSQSDNRRGSDSKKQGEESAAATKKETTPSVTATAAAAAVVAAPVVSSSVTTTTTTASVSDCKKDATTKDNSVADSKKESSSSGQNKKSNNNRRQQSQN